MWRVLLGQVPEDLEVVGLAAGGEGYDQAFMLLHPPTKPASSAAVNSEETGFQ